MSIDRLDEHRRALWGLCYRMTGSAADADDLVQETFVRALKHPPVRDDRSLRPWLVRVAMNLARDHLRQRKRTAYIGPWLPAPIETGDDTSPPSHEPLSPDGSPAARYDIVESVSFAFLLALELLSPRQRAVLLLRDVFDYSIRETAEALGMSAASVKTSLLRARLVMRDYDAHREAPTRTVQQRTRQSLERFLRCLQKHDMAGLEDLLADDVRAVIDGGGDFIAPRRPLVGRDQIMRFFTTVQERYARVVRRRCMLNALPAVVVRACRSDSTGRLPPPTRWVLRCDIGSDDRITHLFVVCARRKMIAVALDLV